MDLRLFLVTFGAIFLAELGDKTQLATMSFAAGNRHALWLVFGASALALVTTSALGVLAGSVVARLVDPRHVKIAAGVLFILIGLATLALPDRKREHAFERLHGELERYVVVEQCKTCAKFQGFLRELAEHDHPELRRIVRRLRVPADDRHDALGCKDCSTDRLRALFADERAKARPPA
ncbi:MAG TPA: TMEM165/GDT1 family protein [Planctomycetota bacterium]|nr:TMEM165/GDT1 family protein [Planctomycetota bacterium]HRR81753.1 TMEM165/GDT1 family protein [Planctomycetota bacterium]HRT94188.1 TMEM165/GDT1 family protein [Planctomycetota bacterium]